jgi:hypothetical protein
VRPYVRSKKETPVNEPEPQTTHSLPLKPFLLLLLALAALAGASLYLTAWCWPRYGEQACGRIVIPVDFLMSLAIFILVALVFDQPWGRLALYSLLIALVIVLGSLVARMVYTVTAIPFGSLPDFLRFLQSALLRMLYLALVQTFVPAAILRGLARRDVQRITVKNAAIFGVILGALYLLFTTGLFWAASILQPGSVAPGYIFTWDNGISGLMLGLAAFLGALAGKRLR